jgi:hypothetical protein
VVGGALSLYGLQRLKIKYGIVGIVPGAFLWMLDFLKCLDCPNLAEIDLYLPVTASANALETMELSETELCALSLPSLSVLKLRAK